MSVRTAANNPLIAAGVNWPVQFYVPKIAARALDQLAIRAKAKAAGVERYTFELSEFKTPPTKARITANAQLTPFIVEAWTELAQSARGDLLIAIAEAAKEALDAIAKQQPRPKP
jgi:hypothetical protein